MIFDKPIIAVDYDGTIVDFAFPKSGPVKAGAKEALQRFQDLGYHVLIYSCRTCTWFPGVFPTGVIEDMVETLAKYEIPYDSIDDGTLGKPPAAFYIDDKGIPFNDNWDYITRYVTAVSGYRSNSGPTK